MRTLPCSIAASCGRDERAVWLDRRSIDLILATSSRGLNGLVR